MQDHIRAFIALEIDDAVRAKLAAMQDVLKEAHAHVSWVKPQNIHSTLVFLGDIFAHMIDPVAKALSQAASGCQPFEIEIAGMGYFGSSRSPRVIWAGIAGRTDALIELQGKITAALLQAGLKPDEKPFKPHLTIGRVRSNRNADGLVRALEENKNKSFGALSVRQVVLKKSILAPTGPAYFSLRSITISS